MDKTAEKIEQGAFTFVVDHDDTGKRLDLFVTEKLSGVQRSRISDLIGDGTIRVNGSVKKPSSRVKSGETVSGSVRPKESHPFSPEDIPLEIIYEDEYLVVINKQPGLVVHPAPGNWDGTLVNGLLHHFPEIGCTEEDYRPGIVHRLDRDTSGVMVVAKDHKTLLSLAQSFHDRHVKKEYLALVHGRLSADSGVIDAPIGRHSVDRKKMSVQSPRGKHALTHYRVEKRFGLSTLVRCDIKTGRTHQIRVHCLSMGHPVVGDAVYQLPRKTRVTQILETERKILGETERQMLHAFSLEISHPATGEPLIFKAPVPEDMATLIEKLEKNMDSIGSLDDVFRFSSKTIK